MTNKCSQRRSPRRRFSAGFHSSPYNPIFSPVSPNGSGSTICRSLAGTLLCNLPLKVFVSFLILTSCQSDSFQFPFSQQPRVRVAGGTFITAIENDNTNDDNTDLFDYFDPLLSPHAYPNGVSPNHKPEKSNRNRGEDLSQFSVSPDFVAAITNANNQVNNVEPDLVENFDPILGPLASPDFVSPSRNPNQNQDSTSERYDPLRLNIANLRGYQTNSPPSVARRDPLDMFDPTLSPHLYPNGTPSMVIGDEPLVDMPPCSSIPSTLPRRIGILLMDHGSRNDESNKRLHELARLYQASMDSNVIVHAAHMEIATPTIPEGLASLVKAGVDEIICHPFFLSPFGRHVNQDVPAIVADAIRMLDINVPVSTTRAVGSDTDLMLRAIHVLVQESSSTLIRRKSQ